MFFHDSYVDANEEEGPMTEYHCDICNLDLSSKALYDSHINGKKHKKNEKKLNETKKEEEKTKGSLDVEDVDLMNSDYEDSVRPAVDSEDDTEPEEEMSQCLEEDSDGDLHVNYEWSENDEDEGDFSDIDMETYLKMVQKGGEEEKKEEEENEMEMEEKKKEKMETEEKEEEEKKEETEEKKEEEKEEEKQAEEQDTDKTQCSLCHLHFNNINEYYMHQRSKK